MDTTGQSIHPVHSIFGAGYIAEHHAGEEHLNLPPVERHLRFSDFVRSLRMLIGSESAAAER